MGEPPGRAMLNPNPGACKHPPASKRERRLVAQRRADHHHADPPGNPFVLDDEDLAALPVGAAACFVVAAPGERTGRALREVAAFLHRGLVAQAIERGGEIGNDLVDAGDEKELPGAEGVGRDAVAAAVGVQYLAARGDRVHTAHEVIGRRGAPSHANALVVVVHRLDAWAQPFIGPVLERGKKADLLERRGSPVHHRRARRDARKKIGERRCAVGAIHRIDAAPLELVLEPGDRLRHALVPGGRLDARVHQSPSFTASPPRKRFEKSLSHLSPSSSASIGSMISYLNLLSGLSTSLLVGTRFPLFRISCPSFESTNSVRSSAACGCGAYFDTPIAAAWPNAG